MSYRKLTPEESANQLAERIASAQQRIEAAVAALQSGAQWRDYLTLQSRLHSYSANNALLIWSQHADAYQRGMVAKPWPTYVAGFQTWRSLGRSVDTGQRGYQILAPNRHVHRSAVDGDGNTRTIGQAADADPGERVESCTVVRGYRIAHVWAAEQTSGRPLPQPPMPKLLRGQAPRGLWDTMAEQIYQRGYDVRLVPSAEELGGANGRVSWDRRLVEVRADMDPKARVKSLIHELGHCLLHEPHTIAATYQDHPPPGRGAKEVEAESVAFIVADAHGLPTDDYTFPYVSAWAGPDGLKTVQAAAGRVAAAARQIITASDVEHSCGGRVPSAQVTIGNNRQPAEPGPIQELVTVPTAPAPGLR